MEQVASNQMEQDYFSALNGDCIFEIFRQLSLDDLCAVSETCSELQKWAGSHFQRKYPELSKSIAIEVKNEVVDFAQTGSYVKYFSRYIKSVQIFYSNDEMDERLAQFMRMHCGEDIKKIEFFGCVWCKSFGWEIQNILRNVEIVEFNWSPGHTSVSLDDILGFCQQIKCLKVKNYAWSEAIEFPAKTYRTLEVFEYHIDNPNQAISTDLETFFRQNPNIKRFVCGGRLETRSLKRILSIVIENSQISELFLVLKFFDTDFQSILGELKQLDARDGFQRIELMLPNRMNLTNISALAALRKFTGLHFYDWDNSLDQHVSEFKLFHNLKILNFKYCSLSEASAIELAQSLPNLEELYYDLYSQSVDIKECIRPFVCFSKNLIKIIICAYGVAIRDGENILPKLKLDRKTLKGSRKSIIYFNKYCTSVNTNDLHSDSWNDLLFIKLVSMEDDDNVDRVNHLVRFSYRET